MAGQVLIKVFVDPSNAFKGLDSIGARAKQLEREAASFNIRQAQAQIKQARISETFLGQRAKALRDEIKLNRAAYQESRKRVEDYKKLTGVQESLRRSQIAKEEALQQSIIKSNRSMANGLFGYKNLDRWDQRLGAEKAAFQQYFPLQSMRRSIANRMDKINAGANGFYFNMANMRTILNGFQSVFEFIGPGRDYEKTMRSVEAVAAKGQKLGSLRNVVKQLGGITPLTTNQNAEAALQFAKAGFTPAQIEQMLPGTINMALATDTSPEAAVKHAAATISMFEMSASKMGEVADMYTKAMLTSPTDMTDLAYAMTDAAPAMHLLGQSFRDTLGMIAELGQNGLKGSKAGNSIKRIALRLSKPTKEVLEAIDEINAYNLAQGTGLKVLQPKDFKVKGRFSLSGYLKSIDRATKSMDAMQKNKINAKLFGAYGASGGAILTRSAGNGKLATRYSQLSQGVAEGAAAQTAVRRQDHLEGDIKRFESGYEALRIATFDAVNGLLRQGVQYATELVGKITEWVRQNPGIVEGVAKWGAALGGALLSVTAIGAGLSIIGVAFNGIAMTAGVVFSTTGGLVTMLALAAAYAMAASQDADKINNSLFNIANLAYETITPFRQAVDLIEKFYHWCMASYDSFKGWGKAIRLACAPLSAAVQAVDWLNKKALDGGGTAAVQAENERTVYQDSAFQRDWQAQQTENARVTNQIRKAKQILAYRANRFNGGGTDASDLDWQGVTLDQKIIDNIRRGQTAQQALASHSNLYQAGVKNTAKAMAVTPQPQAKAAPVSYQAPATITLPTATTPQAMAAVQPPTAYQPPAYTQTPQQPAPAPAISTEAAESIKQAVQGSGQTTNNLAVNVQGMAVNVHCDASSIQTFVQEVVAAAKPLIDNTIQQSAQKALAMLKSVSVSVPAAGPALAAASVR